MPFSKKDLELQKFLKEKGYYSGELDGLFGPKSRAAQKKWLEDSGKVEDGEILNQVGIDKQFIRRVINAFETGSIKTDYSSIFIYADGPGNIRQLTLGWGITQHGEMKNLLIDYIKRGGNYSQQFRNYIDNITNVNLYKDDNFKLLLTTAAKNDQVFRDSSDYIYDIKYWNKAMDFFNSNGFILPLSALAIQDSIIHSGSILNFLRDRFSEKVPKDGGDEKVWLEQYLNTRKDWLSTHSRKILRNTVYRMDCLLEQITKDNWNLEYRPILANGIKVS